MCVGFQDKLFSKTTKFSIFSLCLDDTDGDRLLTLNLCMKVGVLGIDFES